MTDDDLAARIAAAIADVDAHLAQRERLLAAHAEPGNFEPVPGGFTYRGELLGRYEARERSRPLAEEFERLRMEFVAAADALAPAVEALASGLAAAGREGAPLRLLAGEIARTESPADWPGVKARLQDVADRLSAPPQATAPAKKAGKRGWSAKSLAKLRRLKEAKDADPGATWKELYEPAGYVSQGAARRAWSRAAAAGLV